MQAYGLGGHAGYIDICQGQVCLWVIGPACKLAPWLEHVVGARGGCEWRGRVPRPRPLIVPHPVDQHRLREHCCRIGTTGPAAPNSNVHQEVKRLMECRPRRVLGLVDGHFPQEVAVQSKGEGCCSPLQLKHVESIVEDLQGVQRIESPGPNAYMAVVVVVYSAVHGRVPGSSTNDFHDIDLATSWPANLFGAQQPQRRPYSFAVRKPCSYC
mmetsp:Transcript_15388/g.25414  ORF Transcript_15388/g.25414 Transcript_15388/m.25414 type:complete len:212 (-) Transcript_15388:1445-2080(-)